MIERRVLKSGDVRWRARVKNQGDVVADKTFTRRADAETWEREQYRALQLGSFVSPQLAKTSVRDVVEQFLEARRELISAHSLRTDRDNLASLPATFLARPIGSITEADVLDALTLLLKSRAHSTVARTRTSLSALFTWAVLKRYVATADVVRNVRMPSGSIQKPEEDWFTQDTIADMLVRQQELSPHYALIAEFLSLSGIRWGELRAARADNLQTLPFPGVRITKSHSDGYAEKQPKTKRGRRTVPLTERAHEIALRFAAGKAPDDYLFTTVTGLQLRMNLFRRYTSWATTAGGRRVHMLRHYAASQWLRAGIPVNQVAQWLGDDPRTVLRVYAHVMGEQQDRESLALLNGQEKSGPSQGPRRTEKAPAPFKNGGTSA